MRPRQLPPPPPRAGGSGRLRNDCARAGARWRQDGGRGRGLSGALAVTCATGATATQSGTMAAGSRSRGPWPPAAIEALVDAVGRSPQLPTLMASTSAPNRAAWRAVARDMGRHGAGKRVRQLRAKWKALKVAFHTERAHREQSGGTASDRPPVHYGRMLALWERAGRPVYRSRVHTGAMARAGAAMAASNSPPPPQPQGQLPQLPAGMGQGGAPHHSRGRRRRRRRSPSTTTSSSSSSVVVVETPPRLRHPRPQRRRRLSPGSSSGSPGGLQPGPSRQPYVRLQRVTIPPPMHSPHRSSSPVLAGTTPPARSPDAASSHGEEEGTASRGHWSSASGGEVAGTSPTQQQQEQQQQQQAATAEVPSPAPPQRPPLPHSGQAPPPPPPPQQQQQQEQQGPSAHLPQEVPSCQCTRLGPQLLAGIEGIREDIRGARGGRDQLLGNLVAILARMHSMAQDVRAYGLALDQLAQTTSLERQDALLGAMIAARGQMATLEAAVLALLARLGPDPAWL